MNYRHAYHAGNFADVFKHAILVWIIAYLQRKPAAIRVIDTHAGIGRYDLTSSEAARTGEWLGGIARIAGPDATPLPAPLADFLAPYLALVDAAQPPGHGALSIYPGSPVLARALLRPDDRLQVNELHPDDQILLRHAFHGDSQVTVMARDGWEVLKAVLPPKERRGIVLIDPPFEGTDEFDGIVSGVKAAHERFRTGVTIIWYPVKDPRAVDRFCTRIAGVLPSPALRAEIDVGYSTSPATGAPRLGRCGVLVINPPFGLETILRETAPMLARYLAAGPGATAEIRMIEPTVRG